VQPASYEAGNCQIVLDEQGPHSRIIAKSCAHLSLSPMVSAAQ
jgi:hypothetical protein